MNVFPTGASLGSDELLSLMWQRMPIDSAWAFNEKHRLSEVKKCFFFSSTASFSVSYRTSKMMLGRFRLVKGWSLSMIHWGKRCVGCPASASPNGCFEYLLASISMAEIRCWYTRVSMLDMKMATRGTWQARVWRCVSGFDAFGFASTFKKGVVVSKIEKPFPPIHFPCKGAGVQWWRSSSARRQHCLAEIHSLRSLFTEYPAGQRVQ